MDDPNELELLQELIRRYMAAALPTWQEIIVAYYVDDFRSSETNSFLDDDGGLITEKSLRDVKESDFLCRKLRATLAKVGRQPFSSMKLQIKKSGGYEVTYGYDPVDWQSLINPDWNFFPKRAKTIDQA